MAPVLITGVAGFIGNALAARYLSEGHEVVGLDNLNDYYDPALKQARLDRIAADPNFTFAEIDLADAEALDALFATHRFEIVLHMAAQAGVRYSLVNPRAYVKSNLDGFLNVLECCRHRGVTHLLYASSSSVYGAVTKMPFSIHQNVDHPVSLYAATKKANELMAHSYSHLYRLPTTGLRFFTVYGPWGRPDMALYLFAKAMLAGEPIQLFNHGEMRRDFTYIDDIVEAVRRLADRPAQVDPAWTGDAPDPGSSLAPYRIYNIGNNQPEPLARIVECLEKSLGVIAEKVLMPMQPGDVAATFADVDALAREIDFRPTTSIEDGIARFVEWYRAYEGRSSVMTTRTTPTTLPLDGATIAGRLERLPMTGYQRRIFAIIASAWLVDQIDVALLTFLLGTLVAAFHLSPTQAGELAAMTFAGQLVGNILFGAASDRYGRRAIFQVTMLVWGLASLAAAAAWSLGALMVFRFLIGVGVGGEAPVAQAMVSEIVPADVRGKYIAFMEGFWAIGYVLSGAISYFVLPHLGWRWAFAIVGCLSLVVLAVRRSMPESPRWLADKGRHAEADAVMTQMEAEVVRRTGRPLPSIVPSIPPARSASERRSPLATLFSPAYRTRTIMAFGLWFFALIGFFGLNSWIAVLLKEKGFSTIASVGFVTLITIGGIPGFFTAAFALEKVGRKPTTVAFLLCAAAAAYFYGNATGETILFVTGFVMQFFMFGMWSCLYAYTPELYPTRARSTGAGFASAFGRIGAILGPMIVPILVARAGPAAAFEVGAGGFVIAALLVLVLGVETRGRVLETVSN